MAKLTKIEGIGSVNAEKIETMGISTVESLLDRGATPGGRREIAEQTGIGEGVILRWVNMCDLFRIKGIGEEYSDLLEAAGVDTVPELAQRDPDNLAVKMVEINKEKELVRKVPTASQVADWVGRAKQLPRVVEY